jgi:tRNA(fMet)-specific endonuclease VapC
LSVFVLDSNIVSFYIRQNQQIIKKVNDTLITGHEVLISPIAYYEVKRGLQAIKAEKRLREFSALCKVFGIGQLDNSLLDIASDVYNDLKIKNQIIEDADILTAAFCIRYNFSLVTNNTKHFENIAGLNYCDWVLDT